MMQSVFTVTRVVNNWSSQVSTNSLTVENDELVASGIVEVTIRDLSAI